MTMKEADRLTDALMIDLDKRIARVYSKAIETGLDRIKGFFVSLRELEAMRDRLTEKGENSETIERAIRNRMTMLMREQNIVAKLAEELRAAGQTIAPEIHQAMDEVYWLNGSAAYDAISEGTGVRFAMPTKQQVHIILADSQPVFSRIAYANLGRQPAVLRTLKNEMAQAAALGESQQKVIARIRKVTGMSAYQAKRVAQTEQTRVQSQARSDSLGHAANLGLRVTKTWSARMVRTRDSHANLNGKTVMENEKFHTIWGNTLSYPGDPSAPAREVINCHCVIVPDVLTDKQELVEGEVVTRGG